MGSSNTIKSLINQIDSTLSKSQIDEITPNQFSVSDHIKSHNDLLLPEPAAFEEVCNNSSMSSNKDLNDISVCDILADYIRDLDNANITSIVKERVELEGNIKISDVSSTDGESIQSNNSEEFSDIIPQMLQPCSLISGKPFHLFNAKHLDDATTFTHNFPVTKRSAVYYGQYPYSYGSTYHPPKTFAENDYLVKILSYIEVVMPGIKYNSAMVHRYCGGDAYMPHHSDDEMCIDSNSQIVTISFGETRFIEFKNTVTESKINYKLVHGDVFVMDKSTQELFTHSIPKENGSNGSRLSVTLRLISPPETCNTPKLNQLHETGAPYSDLSPNTSVQDIVSCKSQDTSAEKQASCIPHHDNTTGQEPADRLLTNVSSTTAHIPINCPYPNVSSTIAHTPINAQSHVKHKLKTLYISDSMFRNLNTTKLSSEDQTAIKLFYPGASALQMLNKLKKDPEFVSLEKTRINKVIVLTGSNNIDNIYYNRNGGSLESAVADIRDFLNFLQSSCNAAEINVLNILPRKIKGRCDIINIINSELQSLCKTSTRLTYIDTVENNMFSHRDGRRREEFFNPYGRFGEDDVHLNPIGVVRLGRFLKYIAHNF